MDRFDPEGSEDFTSTDPVDETGPTTFEETRPASVRGSGGRTARRFGLSVPGAIGGVLLIGAIAFGANGGFASPARESGPEITEPTHPMTAETDQRPGGADADEQPDGDAPTGDVAPGGQDGEHPTTEPTKEPRETEHPTPKPTEEPRETDQPHETEHPTPKPTEKPHETEKPTPKPTEKPVLEIALGHGDAGIVIEWSRCEVDGAEAYKVVRSSDERATWPLGDGDTLVGVVGMDGKTRLVDDGAPDGTAWYRVFCVRHTGDGYQVLAASTAKGIESTEATPKPTEKPTPKPTPSPEALWIEIGADGGAIVLHWEACDSDVFSHYRILRKTDGEASLLTEVGERDATTYVDDTVEPGVTYRYLVQAKGHVGDDWILLGATDWAAGSVD